MRTGRLASGFDVGLRVSRPSEADAGPIAGWVKPTAEGMREDKERIATEESSLGATQMKRLGSSAAQTHRRRADAPDDCLKADMPRNRSQNRRFRPGWSEGWPRPRAINSLARWTARHIYLRRMEAPVQGATGNASGWKRCRSAMVTSYFGRHGGARPLVPRTQVAGPDHIEADSTGV